MSENQMDICVVFKKTEDTELDPEMVDNICDETGVYVGEGSDFIWFVLDSYLEAGMSSKPMCLNNIFASARETVFDICQNHHLPVYPHTQCKLVLDYYYNGADCGLVYADNYDSIGAEDE